MGKLPPINEVTKSIEILRKEKWPVFEDSQSLTDYEEYFHTKFIKHFNQRMIYLSIPLDDLNYKFYRVRPLDEIKDRTSVREYSYPPREHCKKNRANLPGYPVFYCSPNPGIALIETIRNNYIRSRDKTFCLTLWTIRNSRKYIISPFIHDVRHDGYKQLSESMLNKKLLEALKDSPYNNDTESFRAIMKYLSNSFVSDDENSYSISSFIGHSHIYMPHQAKTDLFLYPSVQSSMKAINIAINPNTVDENLVMKYLLILQVTELDLENGHIQWAVSQYGVCDGDYIDIKPTGTFSDGPYPEYLKVLKEFTTTL